MTNKNKRPVLKDFDPMIEIIQGAGLAYEVFQFATESNHIEGIKAPEKHDIHYKALMTFLASKRLTTSVVEKFVLKIQPNARLRTEPTDIVWIGGQQAPLPEFTLPALKRLLKKISDNEILPWNAHIQYECLHPFMDGNGRSGRAIWLWQMCKFYDWGFPIGFKHMFYYQTLRQLKTQTLKEIE